MANVKIKLDQEYGMWEDPARVSVFLDEILVAVIVAKVELKKGADGQFYHCVTLTRVD